VWTSLSLVLTFLILVDPTFFKFGVYIGSQTPQIELAVIQLAFSLGVGLILNVILTVNRTARALFTTVCAVALVLVVTVLLTTASVDVIAFDDST
jgi:hypothetical protein